VSIDYSTLSLPDEIEDFLRKLTDIEVDKYSDKGGNGYLFFGKQKILNTRVALKFYGIDRHAPCHDEPAILHSLEHENILKVFDARKISDDYALFQTPEINGGDLDRYLKTNTISTKTALGIAGGILSGLSELHREPHRLLHRDLKPGNILVDNTCGRPIIADFGSIKKLPDDVEELNASRHAFIYLPPEAINDSKYNFQSDIYQAGVVLYQILYGHFPYMPIEWLNDKQRNKYARFADGFDQQDYWKTCVGKRICAGTLLDYGTLPVYVCKGIIKIIKKATHRDATKRYQTAAEFMKAIHDFMPRATDWHHADGFLIATTASGDRYRAYSKKKGAVAEKYYAGGRWRVINKLGNSTETIIENLNNLN
jgi:eukaryotic-like serine/threonine-protein kinase